MAQVKVHLDTDIGGDIDDLCALAMLLKRPDVELTGITTVLEHDGKRAGFAHYALELAGRTDIPVAAGADVCLGHYQLAAGLPSEERYWPEPVPARPGPLEAALELLKSSIDQQAIVVGIGGFTNLSLLEGRYPGILETVSLCLMGGYITSTPRGFPSCQASLDYNVQVDQRATKHVFESARPVLVPIEITLQTALRRAHLPKLLESDPLAQLVARQAEVCAAEYGNEARFGATCAGLPSDIINFQHDALACAVAIGWDGVTLETLPLAVDLEDGWLRLRIEPAGRPTRVVTRVQAERFNAHWLSTVASIGGTFRPLA